MSLSLRFVEIQFLGAWAAVILAGCAGSPSTQTVSSALVLPDSIITANKGSVEGLYKSWISPFNTYENRYIPHANKGQLSATEVAVRDGFGRFCSTSGGTLTHKIEQYGDRYSCSTSNGAFIGEFATVRVKGNLLQVSFDSPERVERREAQQKEREAQQKEYVARKTQNGPTGVVVTDEGRFKFLRIGNLKERHVLEVIFGNKSNEYFPIEEIAKIEFPKKCCDFDVTLRDGRTKSFNHIHLINRTGPNSSSSYGVGQYGLPFVLIDPESGQPYTRIFSNLIGIQAILLDDTSIWKAKPADVITTKFDISSPSRIDKYTQKLRLEANLLYADATNKGWIKLLPDGKLTPQLIDRLEYELKSISSDSECSGDAVVGVTSLEAPLRCRVAARELNLVIRGGYSLVTDVTPLSSIIVLNKIKEDLR
jgi:hypothetical protein